MVVQFGSFPARKDGFTFSIIPLLWQHEDINNNLFPGKLEKHLSTTKCCVFFCHQQTDLKTGEEDDDDLEAEEY